MANSQEVWGRKQKKTKKAHTAYRHFSRNTPCKHTHKKYIKQNLKPESCFSIHALHQRSPLNSRLWPSKPTTVEPPHAAARVAGSQPIAPRRRAAGQWQQPPQWPPAWVWPAEASPCLVRLLRISQEQSSPQQPDMLGEVSSISNLTEKLSVLFVCLLFKIYQRAAVLTVKLL